MRCVFCKQPSDDSRSVEHIIPESLGNTEHVLAPGVVCDGCNNYFSRNVEDPFVNSGQMRELRFQMAIPSKRRRVPTLPGLSWPPASPVELGKDPCDRDTWIRVLDEEHEDAYIRSLLSGTKMTLLTPIGLPPSDFATARFVAKVGVEALAARMHTSEHLDEIVDMAELDEVRAFVRRGFPTTPWPFSQRHLYPPDQMAMVGETPMETLHEYDLLYTPDCELFIVVAVFGIEYALNLGGRSIDGYEAWLAERDGRSPLYEGRNAVV
ncbi:MAG: hypothetical protein OXT09_11025 [Myxococcales bacterium]|nr:hypothetical protein [Myxococcales bacterium]